MTTRYKYFFHIVDAEFETEYDYEATFDDHMEADRFITENENDGNVVTMLPPYIVEVIEQGTSLTR